MTHHAHPTPASTADATACSAFPLRNAQGQFAGTDVAPWPHPTPITRFASLDEVGRTIDETVHTILADAATHDPKTKERAPALALAPSPGSGKTTRTQAILASQPRDLIGGDALFLSPTADLSAEACDRAQAIKGNTTLATQIRGRSAIDPLNPGERMCQKWELAEKVARAGLKVGDTLCQLREGQGADETVRRCPLFDSCAYQRQSLDLPEETPVDRYAAHNFVYLPTPTGRDKALRVIDEKFWPKMLRQTVVPVEGFTRHERFPEPEGAPAGSSIILHAARAVVDALRTGREMSSLGDALQEASRGDLTLILTAKELPKCAPDTFSKKKAAEAWLARTRKNPRAAMNDINSGVRGFDLHAARIRRDVPRARVEICLVLVRAGECPRDVIEASHGPLCDFSPITTPDAVSVFGSKAADR